MKKADIILKKIELFEKISFFGKRADFLTKIGQQLQVNLNPDNLSTDQIKTLQQYIFDTASKEPDFSNMLNNKINKKGRGGNWIGRDIDGKIGPRTRAALDILKIYKKTSTSDKDLLSKQNYENEQQTQTNKDYLEIKNRTSIVIEALKKDISAINDSSKINSYLKEINILMNNYEKYYEKYYNKTFITSDNNYNILNKTKQNLEENLKKFK
jgi:hypothetical protein